MAAFDEVQFPPSISKGATGGPQFLTDVVVLASGFEKRNSVWANGRGSWDVATGVKTKANLDVLIAFFRARQGRLIGFRFKDWSDYYAINQATSPATGDGANKVFQLQKKYTSGSTNYVRTIKKPVQNPTAGAGNVPPATAVYDNGVAKTEGVDFTIDYTTGLVTFGTAPAAGHAITADFQFDVPARFDTDQMNISVEALDNNLGSLGDWGKVPVLEIRV